MKVLRITTLMFVMLFGIFSAQGQTLEELKLQKDGIMTKIDASKTTLADLEKQANELQEKIEKLSGWLYGFGGTVGFGLNQNNNWIASPNPTSRSSRLALGLSGYANNIKEKTLWRNSALLTKEWQDVDLSDEEDDKLFDNGTVDILNLSSLAGYRITPKLAATGLGELNTSLGNFLKPGTLDFGAGVTWTPNNDFVLIVHPINYHLAFSAFDNVESAGALGAKLRAEYNKKVKLIGKDMTFSSTFTSFIPYSNNLTTITPDDPALAPWEASLFEYTWLNNLGFNLWKGIGVGIGFGLRGSEFELNPDLKEGLQSYFSLGLNYSL